MSKYSYVGVRIEPSLKDKIKGFCMNHGIDNESEFIRLAISEKLMPEIEDTEFVFESLKQLHDKIHVIEQQQEMFFSFFCFYLRHFLIYNPELPEEHKEVAAASAMQRYQKIFTAFKSSIKDTPSMFESLLADYIEEMDE